MRRIVIAGSAVAGLFAAYVGFNAWLAWGLPARPVSDYKPIKGCESYTVEGITYIGTRSQCQALQHEAVLLKAHPGLAARDGDTLTLFYRGKPTHHLIPVKNDEKECDAVEVHQALALYDPATGQKEQVPLIGCHDGEFENRFVALPDGTRWTVRNAMASPDGRMIATGTNNLDVPNGLDLYDWPSRRRVAHFQPACRVLKWQDETHLDTTCLYETPTGPNSSVYFGFDAKAWRDRDGVWRMQATRWLTGPMNVNDDRDFEFTPGFSLRPLPGFTATAN